MRGLAIGVAVVLLGFGCASGGGGTNGTTSSVTGGSTGGSASCGVDNFTVVCPLGKCPGNSTCKSDPFECVCDEGFTSVTCDGGPCTDNDCEGKGWWCAPREAGACGVLNFTVPCGDGGSYCPSSTTCTAGTCSCVTDTVALSCEGLACSTIDGGCDGHTGDWWCAPLQAGSCGPQNWTVHCATASGGTYRCPTNASCSVSGCLCDTPSLAEACDGNLCNDGGCSYPNWWCTSP